MYTVKVISQFSGAHSLRGYRGKCEELHGHNWRVEVASCAEELDGMGMVVDFKELKGALNGILADLDHKHLNEIEYFTKVNPTSENIARYIHERISAGRPELNVKEVTVWETDSALATYFEQ